MSSANRIKSVKITRYTSTQSNEWKTRDVKLAYLEARDSQLYADIKISL